VLSYYYCGGGGLRDVQRRIKSHILGFIKGNPNLFFLWLVHVCCVCDGVRKLMSNSFLFLVVSIFGFWGAINIPPLFIYLSFYYDDGFIRSSSFQLHCFT
jgi:hypothetical protein